MRRYSSFRLSHSDRGFVESLEGRLLLSAAPVTISVVHNAAEEGPVNGVFRVTRVGDNRTAPLTVTFRVSGTATYSSDYTLPSAPIDHKINVTIPAGELSKLVTVVPIDDDIVESTESVELTAVTDGGVAFDPSAHASLTIADNDSSIAEPPVAHANGPYHVAEGKTETLHGTASAANGKFVDVYEWDFDYDGITFNVDANGATPKFSAADIDGSHAGTVRTIGLRVRDTDDVVSAVSTSTVTITNVAPVAKLHGNTIKLGQSGKVFFTDIVDVPADVAAGFTFRYDFNNDGITDLATKKSSAVVPASFLSSVGQHKVHASVRDKDDSSTTYVATIVVAGSDARSPATRSFEFSASVFQNVFVTGSKIDALAATEI